MDKLEEAASSGTFKTLRLLCRPSDPLDYISSTGSTLLLLASGNSKSRQRAKMIRYLIDLGADVNARSRQGANALHILFGNLDDLGKDLDSARSLVQAGCNLNATTKRLGSPINVFIEATLNCPEKLLVPYYELLFSQKSLNLDSPAARGLSIKEQAKKLADYRPALWQAVLRAQVASNREEGEWL